MTQRDDAAREQVLARLAKSRAEILRLLEPPAEEAAETRRWRSSVPGEFPRSRTMQMLLSGRGLGVVGALLGGLFVARPALAWRLIRMLPTNAVARALIVRAIAALRAKQG